MWGSGKDASFGARTHLVFSSQSFTYEQCSELLYLSLKNVDENTHLASYYEN